MYFYTQRRFRRKQNRTKLAGFYWNEDNPVRRREILSHRNLSAPYWDRGRPARIQYRRAQRVHLFASFLLFQFH
jgi:hypothetical protein